MSSEVDCLIIELETLFSSAREDYNQKFWDNYETYLTDYNSILKKLQALGHFPKESYMSAVPDGQKAYMGVGFASAERAKLRQIVNSSKILLAKLKTTVPSSKSSSASKPKSTEIFIVHGHDEEMKQSVARKIEKLGLKVIILHEQPNRGRTIIEKFTDHSNVSFAVVLLSPDDIAYPKNLTQNEAKSRARQNVILELGYFLGKLGRANVVAIHKTTDNFEIPTDYSGVIWIPYSDGWEFKLVKELNAVGFNADANKLI